MNVRGHGVDLSPEGITERSDGKKSLFVPRAEVREIRFVHGLLMERAAVMIGVGAALSAFAANAALGFAYGRFARFSVAVVCGTGTVGLVMLYEGLRRGPYLRVALPDDVRKIRLDKGTTAADAERLLDEAARTSGYEGILRGRGIPYR